MAESSLLPKWLRAMFAWRDVRDNGTWAYQENTVTGARRAVRIGACYSPKDIDWLEKRDPPTKPMPPIVELSSDNSLTCYLPKHVFEAMQNGVRDPRLFYPSVARWIESHPAGHMQTLPLVEVEVRVRQVVDSGERP